MYSLCQECSFPTKSQSFRHSLKWHLLDGPPPLHSVCIRHRYTTPQVLWVSPVSRVLGHQCCPSGHDSTRPSGDSHQRHVDTTQQPLPSGPHQMPLASHFRASLPVQGSRCHRTYSLPTSMQPRITEVNAPTGYRSSQQILLPPSLQTECPET